MSKTEKVTRNLHQVAASVKAGPAERRRVARRYTHDGLRRAVPFIGVETEDSIMFSATRDRTIGRSLYVNGWWDREGLPAVLARAGLDLAGRTMIEVGANIGTTTVQAARLGANVVAFEPEPLNYRLLRANVAVNLLDDQVQCIQAGCSSEDRDAFMALSAVNDGEHRVSDEGDMPIKLVRLDTSLAELGVDPDSVALLWIDAEGHEVDVLAGADGLLQSRPVVLTEFWPKALATRLDEFAAALADYPTIVDMKTGLVTTIAEASGRHRDELTDLLFLPI